MARPPRLNIDYFPFICKEGKTMHYIETKYGNDGYATWVKLLRLLAVTNNHYLDLSNKAELMFIASKCKVSEDILNNIISDLVDLSKFDSVLWNENKIIWCADFIDSIQDAYKKRNNKCITYEGLLLLLISLGVRKPSKRRSKGSDNPQSKVEYSIEEKNILKNKKDDFKKSLEIYLETYGSDLLNEFYTYWVEKKPKGKKMRWELEKTWELNLRLARWDKNNKGKYNNGKNLTDNTSNR